MKVSRVYEVWVGGDLIEDNLTLEQARATAKHELEQELREHPDDPADVVIDEHAYVTIEHVDDLDLVDLVPQWRDMGDTES